MIDKNPPRLAKMHLFVRKDDISYLGNRISATPYFISPKESVGLQSFKYLPWLLGVTHGSTEKKRKENTIINK